MTRRRTLAALAAWVLPVSGWAAQNGVLPTRLVQLALAAEQDLLAAMREGDVNRLEALLSEDFHLIVAQQPGSPVAGPDWIDAVRAQPQAADYQVKQLIAHEAGAVVVASFVLQPPPAKTGQPARPPVFVVDTWQTTGPRWQLLVRHAASTQGSASSIPGYVVPAEAPVKKY